MDCINARKQLLVYQKAHGERGWKALNLFFRIHRSTRHVASFLGPGELERQLKQMKDNLFLFFVRYEDDDWDIYDRIKTLECKFGLLSCFLRCNFDINSYVTGRISPYYIYGINYGINR